MSCVSLDLGTTTGWAISGEGMVTQTGTVSLKPGRYEGGGMRFLRFTKWLDEMHNTYRIDGIYFEEVRRHAGTDAAHVYGGLMATLTSWCELHHIPYAAIPIGSWKKSLTGKGNASKQMVIDEVRDRGFSPEDDNEADAIGVMLYVMKDQR
jgi:Holliday junction resolvasome RuvABC endonuclease subunit